MSNLKIDAFNRGILSTIGKTPLIQLDQLFPNRKQVIYAKLEYLNPGGSHKDRAARHLVQEAFRTGLIQKGTTIVETTSGNLGIGLAQVCLKLKLKLILVVDPLCPEHTIKIARTFGAAIVAVNQPDKFGNYQLARLDKTKEILRKNPEYVWMNQFGNQHNPTSQRNLMAEIQDELKNELDYIYVPTSSCGTLVGCQKEIDARGMKTKIIPVDAEGSVIFGDEPGKRDLPGLGACRLPEFLDLSICETPIHVNDLESIIGCRQLLENEAILAGGSTGAVVFAARKSIHRLPIDAKVAIIIADRGERYLDTIYNNNWVIDHFTKSHPYIFTNPYLA